MNIRAALQNLARMTDKAYYGVESSELKDSELLELLEEINILVNGIHVEVNRRLVTTLWR